MSDDSRDKSDDTLDETDPAAPHEQSSPFRDDVVGYGRPPKQHQFQPGQSGNPRGRPVGVKSLSHIVQKVFGQKVTITENGRARRVPRVEALLLRCAGDAARGDARAMRTALQQVERHGEQAETEATAETTAEDLAILRRHFSDLESEFQKEAAPHPQKVSADDN